MYKKLKAEKGKKSILLNVNVAKKLKKQGKGEDT